VGFYWHTGKTKLHCRHHNLIHGLRAYAITLLTGWLGLSFVMFPFAIYASALRMWPSLGWRVHILGVAPMLAWLALLVLLIRSALE
jgi:hypothetical protein